MGRTRAGAAAAGITLDTGALIALDRGNKRMIALLHQALAQGCAFRVPSGVLIPLDEQLARCCGELCGATNTSDIIDASVAILGRGRRDPIVTSDPHDLR